MSVSNYTRNVAIVGATGNCGSFITDALLKSGKHNVTALSRTDSQAETPANVERRSIDYDKPQTLVEALRGQDALVITLSGYAPKDTQEKLIRAAADAGVPWILPNEWSPDTANEQLCKDVSVFQTKPAARNLIAELGKSSFIGISTGFWYEWSLAIGPAFGINMPKRQATFFDTGDTKISISTWPQVGRAVAALLSLPINPVGSDTAANLDAFRNQLVYVNSFTVSQKEMFASVLRVTGTSEAEWDITSESAEQRYRIGLEQIKTGDRIGFAKMMYTRVFFTDGVGNTEASKGTLNNLLGLPVEDIDEATKRAQNRSQGSQWTD